MITQPECADTLFVGIHPNCGVCPLACFADDEEEEISENESPKVKKKKKKAKKSRESKGSKRRSRREVSSRRNAVTFYCKVVSKYFPGFAEPYLFSSCPRS